MTNIKQLAANFNTEHGRAMNYTEAWCSVRAVRWSEEYPPDLYKEVSEIYAESVRLEERKKVVDEVIKIIDSAGGTISGRYLLESLKSKQ